MATFATGLTDDREELDEIEIDQGVFIVESSKHGETWATNAELGPLFEAALDVWSRVKFVASSELNDISEMLGDVHTVEIEWFGDEVVVQIAWGSAHIYEGWAKERTVRLAQKLPKDRNGSGVERIDVLNCVAILIRIKETPDRSADMHALDEQDRSTAWWCQGVDEPQAGEAIEIATCQPDRGVRLVAKFDFLDSHHSGDDKLTIHLSPRENYMPRLGQPPFRGEFTITQQRQSWWCKHGGCDGDKLEFVRWIGWGRDARPIKTPEEALISWQHTHGSEYAACLDHVNWMEGEPQPEPKSEPKPEPGSKSNVSSKRVTWVPDKGDHEVHERFGTTFACSNNHRIQRGDVAVYLNRHNGDVVSASFVCKMCEACKLPHDVAVRHDSRVVSLDEDEEVDTSAFYYPTLDELLSDSAATAKSYDVDPQWLAKFGDGDDRGDDGDGEGDSKAEVKPSAATKAQVDVSSLPRCLFICPSCGVVPPDEVTATETKTYRVGAHGEPWGEVKETKELRHKCSALVMMYKQQQ